MRVMNTPKNLFEKLSANLPQTYHIFPKPPGVRHKEEQKQRKAFWKDLDQDASQNVGKLLSLSNLEKIKH